MMDPSSMIYGALLVGGFEGARMAFMRWLRGQRQEAFKAGQRTPLLQAPTVPENRRLTAPAEYVRTSDGTQYAIVPPGSGVVKVVSVRRSGR